MWVIKSFSGYYAGSATKWVQDKRSCYIFKNVAQAEALTTVLKKMEVSCWIEAYNQQQERQPENQQQSNAVGLEEALEDLKSYKEPRTALAKRIEHISKKPASPQKDVMGNEAYGVVVAIGEFLRMRGLSLED